MRIGFAGGIVRALKRLAPPSGTRSSNTAAAQNPIKTTLFLFAGVQPEGRFKRLMSGRQRIDRVIAKTRMFPGLSLVSLLTIFVLALAGCGRGAGNTNDKAELTPVLLSPEDVLSVSSAALA